LGLEYNFKFDTYVSLKRQNLAQIRQFKAKMLKHVGPNISESTKSFQTKF